MERGTRDSEFGLATGYGLHDREVGDRVPEGVGFLPCPLCPDSSSYSMDTGDSFSGGRATGA
jgi:hypothetical protein